MRTCQAYMLGYDLWSAHLARNNEAKNGLLSDFRSVAQVDEIPLSRLKRSLARDFADGGERFTWHCFRLRLSNTFCSISICTSVDALSPPFSTDVAPTGTAVLVAEVVHHYYPKLVDLHNYRCFCSACI